MKNWLRKLLALALVLCCLMGTAAVSSAEEYLYQYFEAPVVTMDQRQIMGSFMTWGSLVCVQAETLCQMEPNIHSFLSEDGASLWLARDVRLEDFKETLAYEFRDTDVVMTERGVFVPFALAMEVMHLNPVVVQPSEERALQAGAKKHGWLTILDGAKVDRMISSMEEIYKVTRYNMHYWKDSENFRRDVFAAEMVEAFRQLSIVEFATRQMSYDGYCAAISKLIAPQQIDQVDFQTGSMETVGMIKSLLDFGGDMADVFMDVAWLDLLGDLKDSYEAASKLLDAAITANEVLDIEDQVEMVGQVHAIRKGEETVVRGLKLIKKRTPDVDIWFEAALKDVLEIYEDDDPLWVQRVDRLSKRYDDSYDMVIQKLTGIGYTLDIANAVTNLYLDTDDKLTGTMEASRYLDIQTCCEQGFDENLYRYGKVSSDEKADYLQNMIDVTNLYILSGIRAQQAISRVDGMEYLAKSCIEALEMEQEKMAQFTEADLHYFESWDKAEDWLESLQKILKEQQTIGTPATYESAQHYSTSHPLYIEIHWQPMVDGKPMDMTANLTGWTDEGYEIYRSPYEGEYTSKSGSLAVHSDNGKWIELEILRHDAVMDITVEYGDVLPFDAPSYMDANVEIRIYSEDEIVADIAANTDACAYTDSPYAVDAGPFMTRGGAGVWYITFRLDHGVLRSVFDNSPVELYTGGDEWVYDTDDEDSEIHDGGWVDEFYTPDGKLQSTKRYNGDGYLLESCWYDYGECTARTAWEYNDWDHLVRIEGMDAMDPEGWYLTFENIYSDEENGVLEKVQLYNMVGTLLGEGPTAADAADAVGMRMTVEWSLPQW